MNPIVQLIAVETSKPSLQDNTGDLDRLRKAIELSLDVAPVIPFSCMAELARDFRQADFKGTAVINDMGYAMEIVDFLEGPPVLLPAMALDLGTTHLEATLVNLVDGKILSRSNLENRQIQYGVDILTRIHFAGKGNGLEILQNEIVSTINQLAEDLALQAGVTAETIRALSVSGNTTMVHLLLGLDPYHLCREPYTPIVNWPDIFLASDLHFAIHPYAPIWVMPSVGSYFGGDLISGILASGLEEKEEVCMLIDVGTNAEVVLGNREWLIACAGAAGPALEGGIAAMGMRAGSGAVERVTIDPETLDLKYQTIEGTPPKGICGSGIIDLVASFYLSQIIDIRGKFRTDRCPGRFVHTSQGPAFVVATEEESADGNPITFGQVDLDAMMRSKAAMYSILTTLTNQVGVKFGDLDKIFVAGAFGRHIDPKKAITLGMLPDLPLETFEPIGNSSLAGAERVLMEKKSRDNCRELINKITYLELNVNQEFMIRFSGSRFIPHTDTSLFPSVPVFD